MQKALNVSIHAAHYAMAANFAKLPGFCGPPIMRSMPTARRFPPPGTLEEHNQACFIVKNRNGQGACVCLLRGGAGETRGGQAAHPRRGPAHRRPTLLKPRELNTRRFPV